MIILRKLFKLIFGLIILCVAVIAVDYFLIKNHFITVNFNHPDFPEWLKFLNS